MTLYCYICKKDVTFKADAAVNEATVKNSGVYTSITLFLTCYICGNHLFQTDLEQYSSF